MTKAEKTKLYNRTKIGVSRRLYNHQLERCKTRNHKKPTYTKYEHDEWLFNQELFHVLYDNWVESGYEKNLKPSVDRLDDYKSYSFDNIQLTTWEENNKKAREHTKAGILEKATCTIYQYNKSNGNFISKFPSIVIGAKETNSNPKAIIECLRGKSKTSNGFLWSRTYKDNYNN